MEKRYNDLKVPFAEYRQKMDSYVREQTGDYNDFLNDGLEDKGSSGFYRTIFYLIKNFLESPHNSQLFIQVPCEELGRTDKEREKNYSLVKHIVAETLCLSTSKELSQINSIPHSIDECKVGTIFCMGTNVPNPNVDKVEARERIWKVSESTKKEGKKYLSEQLPDKKHFTSRQSEEAFTKYYDYIFRLKDTVRISDTPERKKSLVERLSQIGKRFFIYKSHAFSTQYTNALLVSHNEKWRGTLIESELIECPVHFTNRYDIYEGNCEVLVLVGDRNYKNCRDLIQRKLAYEKIKKVVYIGSDIFEGFDELEGAVRFSFTFRDLFSYFNYKNGDNIGVFPYIKIETLSFPWLSETFCALEDKLSGIIGLTSEEKSNLLSCAIYPFLGRSLQLDMEKNAVKLRDYIYENINMPYEEVDSFIQFYKDIKKTSVTPKEQWIKQIINKHPIDQYCYIDNHKSYKDSAKKFAIKNNLHNNRYIIDVKGDWRAYVEILKYLLGQGNAGHYYFLSYCKIDLIDKFMQDELRVYESKYRKEMLNGLSLNINDGEFSTEKYVDGDLSSFYQPVYLDDFMNTKPSNNRQFIPFTLVDKDGHSFHTVGNVIFGSSQVSLQEIYDNKEDYLPAEITFYKTPYNFQLLMKLKYSFPPNRDVDYYAQLWKDRLKDYCQQVYNENFKEMQKMDFPFLKNLRSYYYANSKTKFPNQINPFVRKLMSLKLISQEEGHFIKCANSANRQNSSNGMELKDALYGYRLTKSKKGILEIIENAAIMNGLSIDAESIVRDSLKTIYVEDIIKEKVNK